MYCVSKFFSVIDIILASDTFSHFRKNILEKILKLITTSDDKIREKKLQYDTNSIIIWKNDKYEYLPGEKISSNRRKIIE